MLRYAFLVLCVMYLSITKIHAQLSAQEIVNKTIETAGGSKYDTAIIDFIFRAKNYRSSRNQGVYKLERFIQSADGLIHDVVSNEGFERTIENCPVQVVDSMKTKISEGVNSVHYFANLPYGLNANAVKKELVGEIVIKGAPYYKIKITFSEEGGGTDFEDEFLYWIHKDKYTIDYLAYKYAVNGGGIRFREAYNSRVVNEIRFADYNNYKISDLSTPLSDLDQLFEKGKLKLLSKIELENIYVYVEKMILAN